MKKRLHFSRLRVRNLRTRPMHWWETAAEFTPPEHLAEMASPYDPLGSYTGVPMDGGEPVQDADDI